jgi:hypothetical protein
MANKKENAAGDAGESKSFITNAKPKVNLDGAYEEQQKRVKLKALSGAKHHVPGSIFYGSEVLARVMESNGTAERVK